MKPLTALALVASVVAAAPGADAPGSPPAKGPALDTSFLKLYAETRGFLNGRPAKPKIAPDGKTVFFLRSEAKSSKQKLFAFDVATKQTKELLSSETLLAGADENFTPEEKARRERQRVTAGGFADYHLDKDGKRILVSVAGRLFVFDIAANKAKELKGVTGAIDPKWSPDGSKIAYVRGYDVYAYDLAADKESSVTTGGTAIKMHGLAEFVAQEEMHRHTGYWWSPDSKFIAYEEADHTGVEVWSIADPLKPDVKPQEQYYPRPGKKNVSVRLGVVPVGGGETVWVGWDRGKYEYLADVTWQKYGPLTILLQDRKQQEVRYFIVEQSAGKIAALASMQDDAFLNLPPGSFRWLKEGVRPNWRGFVWVGQFAKSQMQPQVNMNHVTNYAILLEELEPKPEFDGKEVSYAVQAIAVNWKDDFRELVALDPAGRSMIYSRSAEHGRDVEKTDPTQAVLFRERIQSFRDEKEKINAENGPLPVCKDPGIYSGEFNENQSLSVITRTTLGEMPLSTVHRADWSAVDKLPSVALEPDFKPNVTVQKVGDYWTAVVRPRDFNPKKKYPVILDVYGGPRHLHVVQAMRNWLVPQWLADQGFVVVAIDNRGTPGRGRDWERAIYQKFGTVPLEDQVKGLQELGRKFPELDLDRVGIVGWSFGGYMAANGVLRRPDVFKAAVAGAPVTDWEDYDTHYTERYMGLLPESRQAYDEASLIPLAKDLSRPLLLVHGTADDNVYFRHTLKLADALMRAGKEFEVLPLPGVTHMYTADPRVTERLWERSVRFFKAHLGEPR